MDPGTAAALLRKTTENTRRATELPLAPLYASWGIAWLFGLGAMWWSVRSQDPFRGPTTPSSVLLGLLLAAALAVTVVVLVRANHGIEGDSRIQGQMYGLSWPIGFGALFALEGALARQGASETVLGIVGAAGPLLITGLIYLVGAAVWKERSMFLLGGWLALIVAIGAWTGPVTLLLVGAVAGGGGFLVASAVQSVDRFR
jgi:hypothetical protein